MAISELDGHQPSTHTYKWLVLLLTTTSQASLAYVGQGVAALAPFLQQSFHLSTAQVGFAASTNNLGIGLTALIFGNLVDRVGDKIILVIGGVMVGLSILAAAFSPSYWVLLLILFETGMWAASSTPAGSKALMKHFVPKERGMAMGVRQMGVTAGGFLAAITLPLLAKATDWRIALMTGGSIAIVISLIYAISYKSRVNGGRLDGYGIRDASRSPQTGPSESRKERRFAAVFSNKDIWYTSIAGTTLIGSQFVVVGYTQLFLHDAAGMAYQYTFYFLAIAQLTGMIGRVILGIISDKLFSSKRKPILLIVGVLIAILSLTMLLIRHSTPWWVIGVVFALMGFVSLGWNGLWVTFVSELVDSNHSSSALGVAMSILQLGVLVFPVLFGFLVDQLHSYNVSWIVVAISTLVGFGLFTRVRERETQE